MRQSTSATALRAAVHAGLLALVATACSTPDPHSNPSPEPAIPETSVHPGINTSFLDPQLDVQEFTERFEIESREVFAQRHAIAAAMQLEPGMRVADVGSGTGLFLEFLSNGVGRTGSVLAVEISEPFVQHLQARIGSLGLSNVKAHLCSERSIELPPNSIDLAFICDTYHHFEYPRSTMGSIHRALSTDGEVVLVDFQKIPGVSSDWILGHVRADQTEVIAEMNSFGFDLVGRLEGPQLQENYGLRFRKRNE